MFVLSLDTLSSRKKISSLYVETNDGEFYIALLLHSFLDLNIIVTLV